MNVEGCFDLWPDVKYPHLDAATIPNLGAKLHLGVIRNELNASWAIKPITFGPTYVLECSICGKKFRRKTLNRTLNRHKDPYGNDCYGRMGYQVDTLY